MTGAPLTATRSGCRPPRSARFSCAICMRRGGQGGIPTWRPSAGFWRSPRRETVRELDKAVGGLSRPSKMPGHAWSIPASECNVGSRLASVTGSTCEGCYALKGRYNFPGTQNAMHRRLSIMLSDPMAWAESMAAIISRKGEPEFRWHDSGDLQSSAHLDAIVRVAELTPTVQHWLPTREYELVKGREFPSNLCVRLSAHMVDGTAPDFGLAVSTVTTQGEPIPDGAHRCPAPEQGNECGDCRACWSPSVRHVDYIRH